ncbi:MAG: nuclear transport factor 2 family protein [Anaerolineales bacterium]|nr:nuclear transport factor 2 family protein [Anaerolineales bacterium]
MPSDNQLQIQKIIARFASSFDLKDWDGLQACFTESIYTDYSDLHGAPPQTILTADYVQARRESLSHLKLHHLVGNFEIDFADTNSATCRASMIVWRKAGEEKESSSHCVYVFQLTKQSSDWKISGITQKILWNEKG